MAVVRTVLIVCYLVLPCVIFYLATQCAVGWHHKPWTLMDLLTKNISRERHTKYLTTLIARHHFFCFLINLSWSAAYSEQATNQSYIICIVTRPLEMNGLKEGAAGLCLLACSPMWQPRTVLPWQGSQLQCFVLWNQCIALALHIVVYMAVYFGILFANVATRAVLPQWSQFQCIALALHIVFYIAVYFGIYCSLMWQPWPVLPWQGSQSQCIAVPDQVYIAVFYFILYTL